MYRAQQRRPMHGGRPWRQQPSSSRRAEAKRARRRLAGQELPLLRQPPEVPVVRHHLQREGNHRAARRHGARAHPPHAARGAPVRRRHGRRHGADTRDARDAPPAAQHAVLPGGQGDQPRGRAHVARQDGRPLLRAPGHRADRHQPVLHRGAMAGAEVVVGGDVAGVARARDDRHHLARVQRADPCARAVPGAALAGPPQPEDRQSDLRPPGGAGAVPRRHALSDARHHPSSKRVLAPTTTW